jgi:Protein of unknown function with HXXEE motif
MIDDLRSVLIGTSGLAVVSVIALLLTILRVPASIMAARRERAAHLFLIGLAGQCLHFLEEFVTGFQDRFPMLIGIPVWSSSFFVGFNLIWLCIWILSVVGLQKGQRWAFFPAWFFAMASIVNGVAHPILAVVARGYFPGLITSPVVGVAGWLLWRRLYTLTTSNSFQ